MAAKASGKTIRELIDSLFTRLNMTSSGYLPGQNPLMAAAMCVCACAILVCFVACVSNVGFCSAFLGAACVAWRGVRRRSRALSPDGVVQKFALL